MPVADTFTLNDFTKSAWAERPPYDSYCGVGLDHVKALHEATGHLLSMEVLTFGSRTYHVAFVHLDAFTQFTIYLYEVAWWTAELGIGTLTPSFVVFGRTWEGITEVQASPAFMPLPHGIVEQMEWVQQVVEAKGWRDE
jgi:hypothetical protein